MDKDKETEQIETSTSQENDKEEVIAKSENSEEEKTAENPQGDNPVATEEKTEEKPEEKPAEDGESVSAESMKQAITEALKPLIDRLNTLEIKVEKSAQAPIPATKHEAESLNKITSIYEN